MTKEAEDDLDRVAPRMIQECMHNLNAWIKS